MSASATPDNTTPQTPATPATQPAAQPAARPFKPVYVGPAVTEKSKALPLYNHGLNIGTGALAGLGTGLGAWLVMNSMYRPDIDKKTKKKRPNNSGKWAVGLGLVAAGLTTAGMYSWNKYRGNNFSHEYKIPELKEGESPDFAIFISGSNGGPYQTAAGYLDADIEAAAFNNGDYGRTIHLNPYDMKYGKELIAQIQAKYPNARFHVQGHSIGGAKAYELSQWMSDQKMHIHQLDTFDPVSRFTKYTGKPKNVVTWNNYRLSSYPTKGKPHEVGGNNWAVIGGLPGKLEGSNDIVLDPKMYNHRTSRFVPLYRPGHAYNPADSMSLVYYSMLEQERKRQRELQEARNRGKR